MARRIDYEVERPSTKAVPFREDPFIVQQDQIAWSSGVRGGKGIEIMPAVTQLFRDNYFEKQPLDAALGSNWIGNNDLVVDENPFLGEKCVMLDGTGGDADIYETLSAVGNHTTSAFVYAPPPFRIDALEFYQGNIAAIAQPDGILSLGNYKYFMWSTDVAQASVADRWGLLVDNTDSPGASVWVDCLSLISTGAPTGFVPNNSTLDTLASADDLLKYTLAEPLPQSGSISFVLIPFYDNDGSAVDTDPVVISIFPSGANSSGNDYVIIQVDDNGSQGIYAVKKKAGGAAESTGTTGYAKTGFTAMTPIEITLTWDFSPGGTKQVNIFADGELAVESPDWDEGFPNNLVDVWIGTERTGASAHGNHAQAVIQDLQFFVKT